MLQKVHVDTFGGNAVPVATLIDSEEVKEVANRLLDTEINGCDPLKAPRVHALS